MATREQDRSSIDTEALSNNSHSEHSKGVHQDQRHQESHEAPWSVLSQRQKYLIIGGASVAGIFSPISASIYFPAIQTLATEYNKSTSQINLTVTVYMILQALAPAFFTDLAENVGKRPVYIITFAIYIAANIGLALQNSYGALMGLRCLQSTGSSVTAALAVSAAGDVAKGSERGRYVGITVSGALFGPTIGPVIGGILAGTLGWRAIFWFLTICAGCFLLVYILVGLESARSIIGNGSVPPPKINQSVLQLIKSRKNETSSSSPELHGISERRKTKWQVPNPTRSFAIFIEKDLGCILLYSGLLMATTYQMNASTVTIFKQKFGYNDTIIGVCYIPAGIGSMIGSLGGGRVLDAVLRRYAARHNFDIDHPDVSDRGMSFPLARARLLVIVPCALISVVCLVAYGWITQATSNLAGPLIFQFFLSVFVMVAINGAGVMLIDSYPAKSASASAANNISRCLIGAGATAVIEPMLEAMGVGWTFTVDGIIILVCVVLLWPVWLYGGEWRRERMLKEQERQSRQ